MAKYYSFRSSLQDSILISKQDFYNIDNYSSKIRFTLSPEETIVFTNYELLKKYENILLDNTVWAALDDKYKYRPEYLCSDLYGNINLWYVILFINKMENCYQFNKNRIRIILPDNIAILNEIYETERKYISETDLQFNGNNYQLKSLYDKSDAIIKKPNFTIGNPIIVDNILGENDNNIGSALYDNIQFNLSRAYLKLPIYNTRPTGPIYGSTGIRGTILSKQGEIVSLKPMHVGGTAKVYLNNELVLTTRDNTSELINVNKKELTKIPYVIDKKYELTQFVNWYNVHTNGLLVRLKCDKFSQISTDKEVLVKLIFEGGTTVYRKKLYEQNEIVFPVDISSNYGNLITISIAVIGDLTINNKETDIYVAYTPCEYSYTNLLLSKNECYNLRIDSDNITEFYPMISYSFKDYKLIDRYDLVDMTIYDNLALLPTNANPDSIVINNSNSVFKGLQLISLINGNELSENYLDNHLEDSSGLDIYDENQKLLLYKQYSTTNIHIDDYYISSNIYCRNNLSRINGSMGFFVKGKTTGGKVYAYVYMMKMSSEFNDSTKSLLHGLYKLDPENENIDIDSDGINFSNLKKICDTPQYISGNNEHETFVKIVTDKNNIKIYDSNSSRPIINYFDGDPIEFENTEQPTFGLALFNVRNPGYKNLIVKAKDKNNNG